MNLGHNGGFYLYSVHINKIANLSNGFSELKNFLDKMFDKCPDSYFNSGPRSSTLKVKLPFDIIEVKGHEVSNLAELGLEANRERYSNNHMRVQIFMLENDEKTAAMEVPLWMEHDELDNYINFFRTFEPLTGHVDVLRIDDGKVWIWDYKPNARKEKYADTQVYFYALMLSKRTGIPLDKIRCGWFDHETAFLFKPKDVKMEYNSKLV